MLQWGVMMMMMMGSFLGWLCHSIWPPKKPLCCQWQTSLTGELTDILEAYSPKRRDWKGVVGYAAGQRRSNEGGKRGGVETSAGTENPAILDISGNARRPFWVLFQSDVGENFLFWWSIETLRNRWNLNDLFAERRSWLHWDMEPSTIMVKSGKNKPQGEIL